MTAVGRLWAVTASTTMAAAVALNTVVAAIWFVAHLPAAISRGGVVPVGLTATSLEVLAVLLGLAGLRRPARIQAPARLIGIVGLSGLVALTLAASTVTGHSHRHHDPVGHVAEPAAGAPIFGDLFSEHLHDAPVDDSAEPHDH